MGTKTRYEMVPGTDTFLDLPLSKTIPVGQFPSNRLPTGSQSQLRLALPATQAYSFVSPSNDKVVINTATLDNINQVDEKMKKIYVYDGLDLNSPFVGTLYDYVTSPTLRTSSGNVTTIVNFYGTPTDSYALANDFKSLSQYETYNFIVYSNNVTIPNNFQNGVSNAYTFYCTGSGRSYLTDLSFGKDGHKVDFRTLTPSDNVQFLLEYLATGPFARSLPQMIPGKLFTMITLGPELSFTLSTNGDNWLTPYNGRLGTVFSDSLWSPGALPSYNYTFESTTVMKFTFNFHSVIVKKDGEQARVQVGQPGFQPASVTFNHTVTDPGVRVANGTYLTASYIGDSPLSSSIITFEMWNADGTTNAPASNTTATTPSSMESTTKLGSTVNLIGAFVLLFVKFL
uniref:CUB_2 domain-containing protein n=1 Tax=Caenorhabditis tropicalis TaxID=1561998 RepID=A0A1I7U283_9PELO